MGDPSEPEPAAEIRNDRTPSLDTTDEENQTFDTSPFKIDWLDLSAFGGSDLAISGLPGCRFKDIWRKLDSDIDAIKKEDITDVFVLCTRGELRKFRVPDLIDELAAKDLTVHHHPFPDGTTLPIAEAVKLIDKLKANVLKGVKNLVHCYGGFGRSGLVAATLLMTLDTEVTADTAIEKIRDLRGRAAIQSVKQYNYIHDFRQELKEYQSSQEDDGDRAVSR